MEYRQYQVIKCQCLNCNKIIEVYSYGRKIEKIFLKQYDSGHIIVHRQNEPKPNYESPVFEDYITKQYYKEIEFVFFHCRGCCTMNHISVNDIIEYYYEKTTSCIQCPFSHLLSYESDGYYGNRWEGCYVCDNHMAIMRTSRYEWKNFHKLCPLEKVNILKAYGAEWEGPEEINNLKTHITNLNKGVKQN